MKEQHPLNNPKSLRYKLRKKRSKFILELIQHIVKNKNSKQIKICDLGGTFRYWQVFPFEEFTSIEFQIDLINIEEKRFKDKVSLPNVVFNSMVGDGCDLSSISDNSYDLSHSNSVIEHVGNWQRVKAFALESKRIAEYYYIQTPNYWYPIEPHYMLPFVHMMPRPIHTRFLQVFKKLNFDRASANFDENRMLSRKEFKHLFKESKHHTEWLVLPKSFVAMSKL
ncbi:MAG: class I SAM-dependent methyltransferase [Bacteroidota bacterium]